MLALNINDCGTRDAERPMRKQVRHTFRQKLRRFDIERKESSFHGAGLSAIFRPYCCRVASRSGGVIHSVSLIFFLQFGQAIVGSFVSGRPPY